MVYLWNVILFSDEKEHTTGTFNSMVESQKYFYWVKETLHETALLVQLHLYAVLEQAKLIYDEETTRIVIAPEWVGLSGK